MHGKINLQQLAEGNLGWIKGDLNRFRVARGAGAHNFVVSVAFAASRVTGEGARHPFGGIENGLNTPKTSSRENSRFCFVIGVRLIDGGFGQSGGRSQQRGNDAGD
jgi:hypothetical protein